MCQPHISTFRRFLAQEGFSLNPNTLQKNTKTHLWVGQQKYSSAGLVFIMQASDTDTDISMGEGVYCIQYIIVIITFIII